MAYISSYVFSLFKLVQTQFQIKCVEITEMYDAQLICIQGVLTQGNWTYVLEDISHLVQ